VVFILILGVYVYAGVPFTPFHGDEGMQVYAANDYYTLFIDRAPERLLTQPPYEVDSDAHLRILNGSVNRYAIGLAWQDAGLAREALPPRPGWQWALSYDDNARQGFLPSDQALTIARIPSTLFHFASIAMMFLFARAVGGRPVAYAATLIYALHPALLLNGRRALQESAMLCVGLLALWCAARLARLERVASQAEPATDAKNGVPTTDAPVGAPARQSSRFLLWALLTLACGLTLASKHSGVVLVASALLWVFTGGNITAHRSTVPKGLPSVAETKGTQRIWFQPLRALRLCGSIAIVSILALALFIALSPALWNDPLTRLADLVQVRADLLDSQVKAAGSAASLESRVTALLTQPFLAPVQFYEAPTFDVEPIHQSITAYMNTRFAGVHSAPLLGVVLTLLALLGIVAPLVYPTWRILSPPHDRGLLLTLLIIVASLLLNPLPWQRYYLPLTTVLCVYAALGLQTFMRVAASFAAKWRA
jgi:hypothetical protein